MRFVKQIVWLAVFAVLVLSRESARAFALEGPIGNGPDSYQTTEIGYALPGDLAAPKTIGQEFRRNTPIMYYTGDYNFSQYFGAEGFKALDKVFAILNGLTNVDLYTSNLVEFPTAAQRVNQRAFSLKLTDLKSETLGLMMEQLGLWQPTRAIWVLRDRFLPAGAVCPGGEEYNILQRNIDFQSNPADNFQYSSYVNDTLYSYSIYENCGMGGGPPPPTADAVEFPTSPLPEPDAEFHTAVADFTSFWYAGLEIGGYYSGLTRDDAAGLRYLISTNNINPESAGADTTEFYTNSQPALITSQDLNLFTAQAATNGPAALTALYPGLIINSTSNFFGLTVTTNITERLVNAPLDPAGAPPSHPRISTNYATNVTTFFQYTFGNIITNMFSTTGLVGTVTLGLSNSPLAAAGTPATVVTNAKFSFINGSFGDFFLLPPGLCGAGILSNILIQEVAITNAPVTNALITAGASNVVTFTAGSVSFVTTATAVYLPVTCPTDTVGNRQGVGKLTFLRRDFDSLLNQFWQPVTNDYTLYELNTNNGPSSALIPEHIQRVVTTPDFLFDASDIGIELPQNTPFVFQRNVPFDTTDTPANSAGPGTIDPPSTITFNSAAPVYGITGGGSIGTGQHVQLIYGSFDGSTNDPVVYPNGMSIAELENEVLGPFIVTTSLPNGAIGVAYSTTLTGTGGQPPYTWSLTPGSAWPSGITNTPDGQIGGTPTGPAATYDLSVRITDSVTNFNDVTFTLTIDP